MCKLCEKLRREEEKILEPNLKVLRNQTPLSTNSATLNSNSTDTK